jgi:hypothetical protein
MNILEDNPFRWVIVNYFLAFEGLFLSLYLLALGEDEKRTFFEKR